MVHSIIPSSSSSCSSCSSSCHGSFSVSMFPNTEAPIVPKKIRRNLPSCFSISCSTVSLTPSVNTTEFYSNLYVSNSSYLHSKLLKWSFFLLLTLFRMGIFVVAHGWEVGRGQKSLLPKICHIYPAMMKLGTITLYLKKVQKLFDHLAYPLSSADINIFFTGNQQILLYQEIHI